MTVTNSTACPERESAGDLLCVTIQGQRVAAMDKNAHVRVFTKDPALLAEARSTVEEAITRLGAAIQEGATRIGIYTHLRDSLAAAGKKGPSA